MAMIADNYQKEIARKKAAASNEETAAVVGKTGVQSANMVLFFTKKIHQMVSSNEEKAEKEQDD